MALLEREWVDVGESHIFFHSRADASFMSNFHPATFVVGDIAFSCVEQFFQWRKMTMFQKYEVAARILDATEPASMKALARRGKGARLTPDQVSEWNLASMDVMREGVSAKFHQNPDLRDALIGTGSATLVERLSGRLADRTWGTSGPRAVGRNQLGVILMRLREEMATV